MRRVAILAMSIAASALIAPAQFAPFSITTTSVPSAVLGQPYTPVILQTINDPGPVAWSFLTGSIPAGFVVGFGPPTQPTSGTFCYGFPTASGPPNCTGSVQTSPGTYTFTVQAKSLSTNQTATQQYTMAVYQPLQIITTSLPVATANQPYSAQIQATGGTGQYTWSII